MIARTTGLVVLTVVLAACSGPAAPPSDESSPSSAVDLMVSVDAGKGEPGSYTLTCGPPGGSLPDPAAACEALAGFAARGADPFAEVPADQACAQIYGGPATATVTGTWNGADVDARFSRVDGCQIARWDALSGVVPEPKQS